MRVWGPLASVALVVVAILCAVLGGRNSDHQSSAKAAPHILAAGALESLQKSLGHPIYWVGRRPGARLELTEEAGGDVYLRYLPQGVEAGDPRQTFLTIGTYGVKNAVAALGRVGRQSGSALRRLPDGAVVLPNPSSRGSVYLAYPGTDIEVEVFDPAPGRAMALIRNGVVRPVGN